MTDTVTVEMRPALARELREILEAEVRNADEIHSTEETMKGTAELLDQSLGAAEGTPERVRVAMTRDFAAELADVLDHEGATADEYHSTEQTLEEGAEAVRAAL